MGIRSDLGTSEAHDTCPLTSYPRDQYGHLLDPFFDGFTPWKKDTILYNLTSPYGHLVYAIGSGDDFHCFDFATQESPTFGSFIVLHAVINSETGSFIMDGDYAILPINTDDQRRLALRHAAFMVDTANDWLFDNDLRHSRKGWNQDPLFFLRSVFVELFPSESTRYVKTRRVRESWVTPRMLRFGSKRIDNLIATHF